VLKVTNPEGVNSTIKTIRVNGAQIETPFIDPASFAEDTITVEITLGRI
jgi:hypothetical protein